MSEPAEDGKSAVAERIRERTGVDVDASDVRYQDGRAVLTAEGAAKIERARADGDGRLAAVVDRLPSDPTTYRAIMGYAAALAFGVSAVAAAAGGQPWGAVVPGGVALLSASLGRYYQTAERV